MFWNRKGLGKKVKINLLKISYFFMAFLLASFIMGKSMTNAKTEIRSYHKIIRVGVPPTPFLLEYREVYNSDVNRQTENTINSSCIESLYFGEKGPAGKKAHKRLLLILNKALASYDKDKAEQMIMDNSLTARETKMDIREFIRNYPLVAALMGTLTAVAVSAIVLIILRNRMQKRYILEELKRTERESMAKSDFLSSVSHEIRTPMNGIIGLVRLLKMTEPLSAKQNEYLDKINQTSQYMMTLINDILDMSRLEQDKTQILKEPFCIDELLELIDVITRPQTEKKGITFINEWKVNHHFYIGDKRMLEQIIVNLLSNAVKFTQKDGMIIFRCNQMEEREGNVELYFEVEDNGSGIALEDQERIFQPFEQVLTKNSISKGTGLGLSISRNLVRLMGGELEVRSKEGEGACFFFRVRLALGENLEKEEKELASEGWKWLIGHKILVAEDNELNAEIVITLLEEAGIKTMAAANGREAVDLFVSSEKGEYAAILMDIQMPVLNGLKAAKKIRESGHPDALSIPIIAMTANAFKEDRDMAYQVGMTEFLTKPIDMNQMFDLLGGGDRKNVKRTTKDTASEWRSAGYF